MPFSQIVAPTIDGMLRTTSEVERAGGIASGIATSQFDDLPSHFGTAPVIIDLNREIAPADDYLGNYCLI
ncbi:MAG: hypothetical protein M0Z45_01285 [Actinomycetota bacterium]|nr:hypothetical protein [Actinomycetota bacterium]